MLARVPSALAIVLSIAGPLRSALACSVCGCDPAAGTLGVDRPSTQSLRLLLEDRALAKESGANDSAESERENRLLFRAQYSPVTPLTLQFELPVYLWKNHLGNTGAQDDSGHGLGDLTLGARYEVVRAGGMTPRHVLAVTGLLKLPTGPNDRHLSGRGPDEHLQLGTSTFDEIAGLSYVYGNNPWALFANLSARVNGANSRSFQYGNALFGSLGARRNFLDGQQLLLSLEAQARAAGKDRLGSDQGYDQDSGGAVYYATGSAAYALTEDLLVRGLLQVPVATALHGVQSEHPVAYLQLSYDFRL